MQPDPGPRPILPSRLGTGPHLFAFAHDEQARQDIHVADAAVAHDGAPARLFVCTQFAWSFAPTVRIGFMAPHPPVYVHMCRQGVRWDEWEEPAILPMCCPGLAGGGGEDELEGLGARCADTRFPPLRY